MPGSRQWLAAIMGWVAVALSAPASADELPKPTILRCETDCPKWTDPKPIGTHSVFFPTSEKDAAPPFRSDAYVLIHVAITADGHVKDPELMKVVGPQDFAEAALKAVKDWTYEPATADGVPVETPNWKVETPFVHNPTVGARPLIFRKYSEARRLIREQKYSEAVAVLTPVLSMERLNFYERQMVAYLLANANIGLKDYLSAREYAEDATVLGGRFLDVDGRIAAYRLMVITNAATGHYADALNWYGWLKKLDSGIGADDPASQMIDTVNARLAKPGSISAMGRIPLSSFKVAWTHTLLRRNFAFPMVKGNLSNFTLDCDRQKIESAISTTAEWHIPKSWSNCTILVRGDPGATFELVEANE